MLFLRSVFNSGARFKHVLSDTKQLSTCGTLFATSRAKIEDQYKSGQSIGEVGKHTAELWKNLPSTEKEKYQSEAKKETDRRREEFNTLPLHQQLDLKEKNEKRLKISAKISYNKQAKETGRPKQPPNAYSLFIKVHNSGIKGMGNAVDGMKKAAAEWKALSEKDKQAEKLRQQYQEDMKAWEKQLAKKGIEKPIRKVSRIGVAAIKTGLSTRKARGAAKSRMTTAKGMAKSRKGSASAKKAKTKKTASTNSMSKTTKRKK